MKVLKILPLTKPVHANVAVPGSKSYTNRALIIAAMTPDPVTLVNSLMSDDTTAMISCLRALGIKIIVKPRSIRVFNTIANVRDLDYELNADLSGTTIRFMLALSTIIPGRQTLRGQAGLQKRPIGDIVTALSELGANIEYLDRVGYPPVRVLSSRLSAGKVTIKGNQSSQYLSAMLMIAPLIGDMTIEVAGVLISKPFIAMTTNIMNEFGVRVNSQHNTYHIADHQSYKNTEYAVEGDVSSASYFAAIAQLTRSTITLQNTNPHSQQADMGFLKILEQMGSVITYDSNTITVRGGGVQPVTVDMRDCPDQAQTLAVLAAFAPGVTTISGIKSLRIKETERVKALQSELQKMGIKTSATDNSLTIHGGNPHAASIATHGDHRMAMSFAVAGSQLPGMTIQNPDVVSKTFPGFWQQLSNIGIKISSIQPNIVLIGMRGCGKTTVAAAVAKKIKRECLDLDSIMVKKLGMNTYDIVKKYGWDYFREHESAIAMELSRTQNKVISTGGGIILKPENITALKQSGVVILLRTSKSVLVERLANSHHRPPLTRAKTLDAEVQQVLEARRLLYEAAADIIIDTDSLRPAEVSRQILLRMEMGT